ncbi:hypothetical protein FRB95_002202 [Tulasnella sp. JGI-2019a]|nr:hypothetical protein FRB95_002202 [Tulasnella sp. JGI-2019a]
MSFVNVPVTKEGVDTVSFLAASDGAVKIFDVLGSAAFSAVISDMNGSINKVRAYYTANSERSKTLESLVISEQSEKKRTATEGLMWLLRALRFIHIGLQNSLTNKTEELSKSFSDAYDDSLKHYHNFIFRGLYAIAIQASPRRRDFYLKLGSPLKKVEKELEKWLVALGAIIKCMQEFYRGKESSGENTHHAEL